MYHELDNLSIRHYVHFLVLFLCNLSIFCFNSAVLQKNEAFAGFLRTSLFPISFCKRDRWSACSSTTRAVLFCLSRDVEGAVSCQDAIQRSRTPLLRGTPSTVCFRPCHPRAALRQQSAAKDLGRVHVRRCKKPPNAMRRGALVSGMIRTGLPSLYRGHFYSPR